MTISKEILISQDDEKDVFACLDLSTKRLLYIKMNFHGNTDCLTAIVSRSDDTFIVAMYDASNSITFSGVKNVSKTSKLFEELEGSIEINE